MPAWSPRSASAFSPGSARSPRITALARLTNPEAVAELQAFLAERPCVIADGHHRYETALEYRRECREAGGGTPEPAPFDSILAYMANAYAPGNLLLPIHRVIRRAAAPSNEQWLRGLPGWRQQTLSAAGDARTVSALAIETLAKAERSHANRFQRALDSLDG